MRQSKQLDTGLERGELMACSVLVLPGRGRAESAGVWEQFFRKPYVNRS